MKTLQVLSFRIAILSDLGIGFLSSNNSYYLRFLFPTIYRFVVFIQRNFRWRMAKYQKLDREIESLCSPEFRLMPTHSIFCSTRDLFQLQIQPGYHLVVFCPTKKIYHHGIVVDITGGENAIIHCNMKNPAITYCSAKQFFGLSEFFFVVQHEYYKIPGHNDGTVQMANCLVQLPSTHSKQRYDLLNWNCECFVVACITRGLISHSEQVKTIWNELNKRIGEKEAALFMAFSSSIASSSATFRPSSILWEGLSIAILSLLIAQQVFKY